MMKTSFIVLIIIIMNLCSVYAFDGEIVEFPGYIDYERIEIELILNVDNRIEYKTEIFGTFYYNLTEETNSSGCEAIKLYNPLFLKESPLKLNVMKIEGDNQIELIKETRDTFFDTLEEPCKDRFYLDGKYVYLASEESNHIKKVHYLFFTEIRPVCEPSELDGSISNDLSIILPDDLPYNYSLFLNLLMDKKLETIKINRNSNWDICENNWYYYEGEVYKGHKLECNVLANTKEETIELSFSTYNKEKKEASDYIENEKSIVINKTIIKIIFSIILILLSLNLVKNIDKKVKRNEKRAQYKKWLDYILISLISMSIYSLNESYSDWIKTNNLIVFAPLIICLLGIYWIIIQFNTSPLNNKSQNR